ncbi:uncharacterized protein LOC126788237 [Argentina anserina]|uniref:uncharacterized protein LOC126788237 n=1 Tax=Argentina anserina TaxID=57926 RepID=UPI00217690DC|nr:uncharacterized protein LOC126788237 [Potentilla anserina]
MDNDLGERLIGEKSMGSRRWRKLYSRVKNRSPSFRLLRHDEEAAVAIRRADQEFRIAILVSQAAFQFISGINGLHQDDPVLTERTEEAIYVNRRYYCHQCRELVSATVDFNVACPLCQGNFIEECGGVSSMHLPKPSEAQPSSTDSNGHGVMEFIPSTDQIVVDIVENNNDSTQNSSPVHSRGSHDYNNYGETNQALGHDDSNLSLSPLLSVASESSGHAVTSNSEPGHAVLNISNSNTETLIPVSTVAVGLGANVGPGTRIPSSVWIFSVTGFGFEAVSAFFDQVSTPRKPHYALYGMLLSIVAVLVCILDLTLNAMKQRRITSDGNIIWGILPEIFGLALACIQCISSTVQFSFLHRHAANPWKVSLVPFLFFFVLFAFKYRNGRN